MSSTSGAAMSPEIEPEDKPRSRAAGEWKGRMRSSLRSLAKALRVYQPMLFPTYPGATEDLIAQYEDSVRYSTLALALQRIEADGVPGSIAEIGVYRGATSAFIRQASEPSRRLYLFDTFEGFPEADLKAGVTDRRFTGTSEEMVRKRVGQANVEIRKGYFPETAIGLEAQQFALVMLDVDLYAASRSTLEFFYPRLPRGGFFLMHDYNSPESEGGVSRAASEFLADKPEQTIEIPDLFGTALFRKI